MAERIYEWIVNRAPRDTVFFDIDSIAIGTNFTELIKEEIAHCQTALVIIGPQWLDDAGELSHFVRVEVEAALQHGLKIIPVLVLDASMPPPEKLPVSVRVIAQINAAYVRAGRDFHRDMEDLAQALNLPPPEPAATDKQDVVSHRISRRTLLVAAASVAGVAATGFGVQRWFASHVQQPAYTSQSVVYIYEGDSSYLFALNLVDGSVRWKLHITVESIYVSLVTVGTTVYFGTPDGIIYALDGATGAVRWRQSIPGASVSNVFVVAGTAYVNSGPASAYSNTLPNFYAFTADNGNLLWQVGNFSAAVVQDAAYGFNTVRSSSNGFNNDDVTSFSALNLQAGTPVWSDPAQSLVGTHLLDAPPLILANQALYSLTSPLYAINATTGSLLWQAPIPGPQVNALPSGDSVYVSCWEGSGSGSDAVMALNTADGAIRWRLPITPRIPDELGDPSPITLDGDTALFTADGVFELDAHTGDIVSHYLSGQGTDGSLPLIAGAMLYVAAPGDAESSFAVNSYATVFAVSRQTSDRPVVWQKQLPSGQADNLTVVGDLLLFSSGSDGLYAVNRMTGSVRWRFKSGKGYFSAPTIGPQ